MASIPQNTSPETKKQMELYEQMNRENQMMNMASQQFSSKTSQGSTATNLVVSTHAANTERAKTSGNDMRQAARGS